MTNSDADIYELNMPVKMLVIELVEILLLTSLHGGVGTNGRWTNSKVNYGSPQACDLNIYSKSGT